MTPSWISCLVNVPAKTTTAWKLVKTLPCDQHGAFCPRRQWQSLISRAICHSCSWSLFAQIWTRLHYQGASTTSNLWTGGYRRSLSNQVTNWPHHQCVQTSSEVVQTPTRACCSLDTKCFRFSGHSSWYKVLQLTFSRLWSLIDDQVTWLHMVGLAAPTLRVIWKIRSIKSHPGSNVGDILPGRSIGSTCASKMRHGLDSQKTLNICINV